MSKLDTTRLEELLDWLAEEVATRLRAQPAPPALEPPSASYSVQSLPTTVPAVTLPAAAMPSAGEHATLPSPALEPGEMSRLEAPASAPAQTPPGAAKLLSRLAVGLLAAIVLINIPLGPHGAALARMIPSSASLVIRNGLLVKEAGKPEVYVYEDGAFRWITDLDAFQRYGYRWENVHEVGPEFLAGYPQGRPLSIVAKCYDSPHIYRLENGVKRWIVDIATFEAEGYRWSDVQFMDCYTLQAMPTGESIPPGHGSPPEP